MINYNFKDTVRRQHEGRARQLIAGANLEMENKALNIFRSGLCGTIGQSRGLAIQKFGKQAANQLEHNFRMMGAKDVKVTCP